LHRYKAKVSYSGLGFHGFVIQGELNTVEKKITDAIFKITKEKPLIVCAGRTDANVHALNQVIHFDLHNEITDLSRFKKSLNSLLEPNIVFKNVEIVDLNFSARFDAKWRHYRYHILLNEAYFPFFKDLTWFVREKLDVRLMNEVALGICGVHDFAGFCKVGSSSTVKTCYFAKVKNWSLQSFIKPQNPFKEDDDTKAKDLISFDIVANSFCHNMVRALVGALVAAGGKKLKVRDFFYILHSKDKRLLPTVAPPQGLVLVDVGYEDFYNCQAKLLELAHL
jgi:tRNA pseudouridine38-40 synthase